MIQERVTEVRDGIDRFSEVKKKCTKIEDTAGDIKGLLDGIREDVSRELDRINAELSKSSSD